MAYLPTKIKVTSFLSSKDTKTQNLKIGANWDVRDTQGLSFQGHQQCYRVTDERTKGWTDRLNCYISMALCIDVLC